VQFSGITIFLLGGTRVQVADREASSCNAMELPRFLVFKNFLPFDIIDKNRPLSRPPILQNECRRWRCS